ncbi:hypothetical protein PUN28_003620 [Cardiocondyla obscurior]|uniref:Uncharacterized protein n=1 Tax=Cardiocondyla obscurior TaxID=286306 RepID=A0AAW2GJR0_9HYME
MSVSRTAESARSKEGSGAPESCRANSGYSTRPELDADQENKRLNKLPHPGRTHRERKGFVASMDIIVKDFFFLFFVSCMLKELFFFPQRVRVKSRRARGRGKLHEKRGPRVEDP